MVEQSFSGNISFGLATHVGKERSINQDSVGGWISSGAGSVRAVFVLADGMGGGASGEDASRLAVEFLIERFSTYVGDTGRDVLLTEMKRAVSTLNRMIYDLARSRRVRQMGTTVDLVVLTQTDILIAHVGDGRVYSISQAGGTLITEDHSVLNDLIARGVAVEVAVSTVGSNQVTHIVGTKASVDPRIDVQSIPLSPGIILSLCCDGVHGSLEKRPPLCVGEADMAHAASQSQTLQRAAESLVRMAVDRDGSDNATVLLIRVDSSDSPTVFPDGYEPDTIKLLPDGGVGDLTGDGVGHSVSQPSPAREILPAATRLPTAERAPATPWKRVAIIALVAAVTAIAGATVLLVSHTVFDGTPASQGTSVRPPAGANPVGLPQTVESHASSDQNEGESDSVVASPSKEQTKELAAAIIELKQNLDSDEKELQKGALAPWPTYLKRAIDACRDIPEDAREKIDLGKLVKEYDKGNRRPLDISNLYERMYPLVEQKWAGIYVAKTFGLAKETDSWKEIVPLLMMMRKDVDAGESGSGNGWGTWEAIFSSKGKIWEDPSKGRDTDAMKWAALAWEIDNVMGQVEVCQKNPTGTSEKAKSLMDEITKENGLGAQFDRFSKYASKKGCWGKCKAYEKTKALVGKRSAEFTRLTKDIKNSSARESKDWKQAWHTVDDCGRRLKSGNLFPGDRTTLNNQLSKVTKTLNQRVEKEQTRWFEKLYKSGTWREIEELENQSKSFWEDAAPRLGEKSKKDKWAELATGAKPRLKKIEAMRIEWDYNREHSEWKKGVTWAKKNKEDRGRAIASAKDWLNKNGFAADKLIKRYDDAKRKAEKSFAKKGVDEVSQLLTKRYKPVGGLSGFYKDVGPIPLPETKWSKRDQILKDIKKFDPARDVEKLEDEHDNVRDEDINKLLDYGAETFVTRLWDAKDKAECEQLAEEFKKNIGTCKQLGVIAILEKNILNVLEKRSKQSVPLLAQRPEKEFVSEFVRYARIGSVRKEWDRSLSQVIGNEILAQRRDSKSRIRDRISDYVEGFDIETLRFIRDLGVDDSKGTMGKEIAEAIRKKWEMAKEEYEKAYALYNKETKSIWKENGVSEEGWRRHATHCGAYRDLWNDGLSVAINSWREAKEKEKGENYVESARGYKKASKAYKKSLKSRFLKESIKQVKERIEQMKEAENEKNNRKTRVPVASGWR